MVKIDKLKQRAVLWHLFLSLLLSVAIAGWLVTSLFPAPFTFAAGALTGLVIVVSVDMCLGPMLTLLLIHSKKSFRENLIDAGLVAFLQFSALGYGLWQVSLARPAAVVFWQDSFYLVKAFDYQERYGQQIDLKQFKGDSVPLIYARYPLLLSELQQLESAIRNGIVPYEQISLYRPVAEGMNEIRKSPVDMTILLKKYPELQRQLDGLGTVDEQKGFVYSRLHSEYGTYVMVFNNEAKLLGLITLPS